MNYREKFGKYEVRIDGMCYKWFKNFDKAEAEYNEMAEALIADEEEVIIELVNSKTNEVIAITNIAEELSKNAEGKTVAEMIIAVELPAMEERLEKLVEFGAPDVIIEGQKKAVEAMRNGELKVGGAKEKLNNIVTGFEIRKGNGGKQYMLFSDGTMYFPRAKYGRFVK